MSIHCGSLLFEHCERGNDYVVGHLEDDLNFDDLFFVERFPLSLFGRVHRFHCIFSANSMQ